MRTISMVACYLSCALAMSCSEDEDPSLAGLAADTSLGGLRGDEQDRVCDALHVRQLEDRKDADYVHGRCLIEAASQARWRSALDSSFTWLEACERIFGACVDVRDEHALVEDCGPFGECTATVGDLEHCIDSASDAYIELSEHTCGELAEDEGDEVLDALSERVAQQCRGIFGCSATVGPEPDLDAGDPYSELFDATPELNDPPDTLSNAEWLEQLDATIAGAERSVCGDAGTLLRDAELDDVAQELAMNPRSTPGDVGFDAGVSLIWQLVQSSGVAATIDLTESFLNEEPLSCVPRYGLGIAGEPGEQRSVVLLLAAAE